MTEMNLHDFFLKEQHSKKESLEFLEMLNHSNFDKFMTFMGYKITIWPEDNEKIYHKRLIRLCVTASTNIRGRSMVTALWSFFDANGAKLDGSEACKSWYTEYTLINFEFWLDALKIFIIEKEYPVDVRALRYLIIEEVGPVPEFLEDF